MPHSKYLTHLLRRTLAVYLCVGALEIHINTSLVFALILAWVLQALSVYLSDNFGGTRSAQPVCALKNHPALTCCVPRNLRRRSDGSELKAWPCYFNWLITFFYLQESSIRNLPRQVTTRLIRYNMIEACIPSFQNIWRTPPMPFWFLSLNPK